MDREKKPRPPTITKLHPGTESVAAATGWSVEVVRLVADLPGCPRVRGGKGKRFTSVEAFKAWFEGLPGNLKRSVPEIDRAMRVQLGEEIAKLTWCAEAGLAERLARAHDYEELVQMRDRWKDHDDEDQGEQAARAALEERRP